MSDSFTSEVTLSQNDVKYSSTNSLQKNTNSSSNASISSSMKGSTNSLSSKISSSTSRLCEPTKATIRRVEATKEQFKKEQDDASKKKQQRNAMYKKPEAPEPQIPTSLYTYIRDSTIARTRQEIELTRRKSKEELLTALEAQNESVKRLNDPNSIKIKNEVDVKPIGGNNNSILPPVLPLNVRRKQIQFFNEFSK
ncbi:hypothetical protein HDU92_000395 [Lobulomyces angularis]|nr:hypothetical protein HDU92_000395 [Lobulomyces angularis]